MAKPCKYTLKDGTVLDFDQARQYVMDNIADLIKDSPTLKAQYDATTKGKVEEGDKLEYKEGVEGGKTAEAGGGNRPVTSSITEEQGTEEVKTPSVYATLADKARAKIKELKESKKPYDPNNPKPYLASSSFIPLDAHIAALEAFAKVMDGADKLSEAYTSGATLKEAVKAGLDAMRSHPDFKAMDSEDKQSAIDEFNDEYSEAAIPMEDDLNPEGYAERQEYNKNRVSRIVQRALQGGSLSGALVDIIGKNENADGSFVWAEESVHIKDVAKIIDGLIEKLGPNGISKMMEVASDVRIPSWFRALAAGKINDILYLQERAAETKADKDIAIDRAVTMLGVLAGIGEEAGRTLRFIQEVYRQSPIAYARSVKNKIDATINTEETQRKNALMLENIANIINGKKSESTSSEDAEKARAEEVTETAAAAADQVLNNDVKTKEDVIIGLEAELAGIDDDIAAIEAQIAEERAAKKQSKGKGGGQKPIAAGIRNLFAAPQPSDLQKRLAELKAKKKEIEAKVKIMKTAPAAPVAPTKEAEEEAEKATASEKLAKRILDRAKDKKVKENDVEKMLIDELFKAAKDITPQGANPNKPITALERLKDAIKNFDQYRRTWDSARAEVEDKIDNMRISPSEKAAMKESLDEYFEKELETPFSKDTAAKFAKEALSNKAISKVIETYAAMGVDLSVAEDEVLEKVAFALGLKDDRAIDAFREIIRERFEEINNRNLDAKAKRTAQNEAIKEAKKKSKEAEFKERKRTGGTNESIWQKRKESLAAGLRKQLAKGLLGKSVKQKTLMEEFAANIKKTIQANISPIVAESKIDVKKATAIELIGDVLNNIDAYQSVVNEAQAQIAEKYKDNPEVLLLLDDALSGLTDISFTSKLAQGGVKQALKDAGYTKPGGAINWNEIIGNSKTAEEAKRAIYDKVKELAGEFAANRMKPQLDAAYDNMIAEKKIAAIDKILKAQGKPPIKRGHLPSVVYKVNRLIALNGSATGANIQSAIGHLLGTTSITPQQSARLDELSQSYFNAPNGYLRAAELERMTNYIDRISKGKGRYIIATLHQHFVAGLISGVLTGLKNATVGLDLAFGIGTEYARSGFDSNVLKSALYGMKEGLVIGKNVIGKGYAGRTISAIDVQQGGKQNMSPRIAEFVFDLVPDTRMGRNVVRASNLWNVAKYMSRGNEGVDSLFGSVSANMTKYVMLKDYYKDKGMSRNAAGAAAYTDLYVTEEKFNDAMDQARGEIDKMGISPSENMVKRRAYEIIDENREIPQVTKDLAEEAANQLTYKKPGLYGITHALPFIVHSISRSLDKFSQSKHLNPKVAGALAESGKYGLNTVVPFAGIGANVTEAGLDWLPIYGTTKMIGGIINYHAFTKDKTGEKAVKLKVALRQIYAKQAVTITVSAYVFAMLLAGDDDDEKEIMAYFDLVKGTGGKYVRKNPIPGEEKDRTILGVSLDITASLQTALLVIADFRQQVEENPDYTNMDLLQYAVNAYKTAVLASSILKSGAEIIDLIDNIGVVDKSKFLSKKAAQVLANSFLPATGMAKQGGDLKSPVKKEAIGFFDNIMNEGGIYTTWAIDREKFDWRGRPFATGDFYASNPRAFTTNMGITKNILKADDIDKWAANKNVKTVGPKTDNDKEEDQFRYSLIVPETPGNAPFRFMDNYEVYDFNKRAAQLFNKEITEYWGSDRDVMIAATEKEAQEIVSLIWGRAKERSFYELNLKVNPRLSETYSEQEFKDRMNRVAKEPERSRDVGKLEFRIKKKPIFE